MLEELLSVEEKNDIEKELAKALYKIKKYKENIAEFEKG